MKKGYYLPSDDQGKMAWLNNFSGKLSNYATVLNIPGATVTQTTSDSKNFTTIMQSLDNFRNYNVNLTTYKNLMREGSANGQSIGTLTAAPATPVFPTPAVTGDIFGRVSNLVQVIKRNPAYTEAMGQDLGIIGSDTAFSTLSVIKPTLNVEIKSGHPYISWKKGQSNAMKLMVDRGNGTFEFLTVSTRPNYTDSFALPAMGLAALWKYMGIYLVNDEETGDWSDAIQITVTGTP